MGDIFFASMRGELSSILSSLTFAGEFYDDRNPDADRETAKKLQDILIYIIFTQAAWDEFYSLVDKNRDMPLNKKQ